MKTQTNGPPKEFVDKVLSMRPNGYRTIVMIGNELRNWKPEERNKNYVKFS